MARQLGTLQRRAAEPGCHRPRATPA